MQIRLSSVAQDIILRILFLCFFFFVPFNSYEEKKRKYNNTFRCRTIITIIIYYITRIQLERINCIIIAAAGNNSAFDALVCTIT